MSIVVLCVDLLDRSRITAAHPDATFVRSSAALLERVEAGPIGSVIVDLSRPDAIVAISAAAAAGAVVTAYGAHVDTELLTAARAAGCAEALPRSRFFARLDRTAPTDPESEPDPDLQAGA